MSQSRKKCKNCSKTSTAVALAAVLAGAATFAFSALKAAKNANQCQNLLKTPVNKAEHFLESADARSFMQEFLGINITNATLDELSRMPKMAGKACYDLTFLQGGSYALGITCLLLILALLIQLIRRWPDAGYSALDEFDRNLSP